MIDVNEERIYKLKMAEVDLAKERVKAVERAFTNTDLFVTATVLGVFAILAGTFSFCFWSSCETDRAMVQQGLRCVYDDKGRAIVERIPGGGK